MRFAGVVLAGGASRRMGRTKALIDLDGRAMADRVLDALRDVGADPTLIVGGDAAELASLSAPLVPDLYPGEGPLGGVVSALDHLATIGEVDAALILACDLGSITGDALWPILEAAAGDGHSRAWVAAADRMEPTCALWSLASLDVVRDRFDAGERALHRVISELPHTTVTVDAGAMDNINRLEDLPTPDPDR